MLNSPNPLERETRTNISPQHTNSSLPSQQITQSSENQYVNSPINVQRALNLNRSSLGKLSSRATPLVGSDVAIDITETKETETQTPDIVQTDPKIVTKIVSKILQSRTNSPAIVSSSFPSPIGRSRQISDPLGSHDMLTNVSINEKLYSLYNTVPNVPPATPVRYAIKETVWNEELVHQFMMFSQICKDSGSKCKARSIKNKNLSIGLKICILVASSLVVVSNVSTLNSDVKQYLGVALGVIIAIVTGVVQLINPEQIAEITKNACLQLERMARSISIEISKSPESRVDPFDFIAKLENEREKLLKDTGVEDE